MQLRVGHSNLRPIGTVHPVKPDGTLPRLGIRPSAPWDLYASKVGDTALNAIGDGLVSVALRGSTVRATAVIGVSDLDLVIVTKTPVARIPETVIVAAPDLEIETLLITEDALLQDAKAAWLRFNLAFCGYTVWGRDLVSALSDPVLDTAAIGYLRNVSGWHDKWQTYHKGETTDLGRKQVCMWLMKRCVRSLFESVMLEEGVYTRDIQPCAEIAAQNLPEHRELIMAAAELAVSPSADPAEVDAVARPILPVLQAAAAKMGFS